MKWRNSKERELLSSGGTRESTLPGKGNQNPDLSDPVDAASSVAETEEELPEVAERHHLSHPGLQQDYGSAGADQLVSASDNDEDIEIS